MSQSVKANWFSDLGVAGDDSDPFGEKPRVEALGRRVELDGAEQLRRRLTDAIDREGALYANGVTCAIRDDPQTSCASCPLRHIDPLDALTPLCQAGVQQEALVTRLRILEIHGQDQGQDGSQAA